MKNLIRTIGQRILKLAIHQNFNKFVIKGGNGGGHELVNQHIYELSQYFIMIQLEYLFVLSVWVKSSYYIYIL